VAGGRGGNGKSFTSIVWVPPVMGFLRIVAEKNKSGNQEKFSTSNAKYETESELRALVDLCIVFRSVLPASNDLREVVSFKRKKIWESRRDFGGSQGDRRRAKSRGQKGNPGEEGKDGKPRGSKKKARAAGNRPGKGWVQAERRREKKAGRQMHKRDRPPKRTYLDP